MNRPGVVVIGRNEGERLRRCLRSVIGGAAAVVYVDSNSSDGSVNLARQMGATVVELDLSIPFTAARARNEGFARLMQIDPSLEFVQFVDGDCEIMPGWLTSGVRDLTDDPSLAVVFGDRHEQFPYLSVYNRLCEIEWNTPIGPAKACGGDAMMRVKAFREVGGFDGSVIAGEEPELCVRLRQRGWGIMRVQPDMSRHDASMTRFGQWWKRNVRAGHAYAQGAAMHGGPPERHWVRETRSNWLWGLALPVFVILTAPFTYGLSTLLLSGYVLMAYRIHGYIRRRGFSHKDAETYAVFTTFGKIPQALGQLKYWTSRLRGRRSQIIEYKTVPTSG